MWMLSVKIRQYPGYGCIDERLRAQSLPDKVHNRRQCKRLELKLPLHMARQTIRRGRDALNSLYLCSINYRPQTMFGARSYFQRRVSFCSHGGRVSV